MFVFEGLKQPVHRMVVHHGGDGEPLVFSLSSPLVSSLISDVCHIPFFLLMRMDRASGYADVNRHM